MTKAELVAKMAEKAGLTKANAERALTEFLNAHEHIQLHYMIPKSIVSLLVAIFVNYPGQKKFVFKQ